MYTRGKTAAAVFVALGMTTAAAAEPLSIAGQDESQWRFVLTPYAFLPTTTKGTSTVSGVEADIDMSLGEVVDVLQLAAAVRGEAWKDDFGIILDYYYSRVKDDASAAHDAGISLDATVVTKLSWASLLGSWRFAEGVTGPQSRRWAADISAGVRWTQLRQEVELDLTVEGAPEYGGEADLGGTKTWLEPTIGIRGAWEVADRWTIGGRIDLGGFGVNNDKLQYVVLAGADWRPWDRTSLKLGWQFYGINFSTTTSEGKFAYKVDQNGPYLGLTFRF